jgi:hypothetical protein
VMVAIRPKVSFRPVGSTNSGNYGYHWIHARANVPTHGYCTILQNKVI